MTGETPAARIEHVRAIARRARRRRTITLAIAVPVSWALLMVIGPVPFTLLVFAALGLSWVLGWKQRARNEGDLKFRRRRSLERAIENGGPSRQPTARHKSPDPNAAEKALYGNRMSGVIRGAWPHGRI